MSQNIRLLFAFIFSLLFFLYFVFSSSEKSINRGVYFWESAKYNLTEYELNSLEKLKLNKMYIKFFEVEKNDVFGIHPTAKSEFFCKYDSIPVEFIPVVYIRNEVFKGTNEKEIDEFVSNFIFLIKKKYSEKIGNLNDLKEIQIDCDWTQSTQNIYFSFLKKLKSSTNLQISATLRLYAYKFPDKMGVLPVDRAMLMCYNLLNVHENQYKNSILDLAELEKYLLGAADYPIPLDVALPTYQAMHVYQNNSYVKSLHNNQCAILQHLSKHSKLWYYAKNDFVTSNLFIRKGDKIKYEFIDKETMQKAIKIIKKNIDLSSNFTLSLYHLNEFDFKKHEHENLDSYYNF